MEKFVLRIFQEEIKRQCKFAVIATSEIKSGLSSLNADQVWYAIQNFLVAVANISKIFWPSYERYQYQGDKLRKEGKVEEAKKRIKKAEELKQRGEELRKDLGVCNNSPIHLREFRNHFEHFDERLEDWAKSSKNLNFVDSNIGPSNAIVGFSKGDYIRNFDNVAWRVTFRGEEYELKPVVKAIHELYQKLNS